MSSSRGEIHKDECPKKCHGEATDLGNKHQQDRLPFCLNVFISHGAAETLASSAGMDWSVRAQHECQAAAQHSEGKLGGVAMLYIVADTPSENVHSSTNYNPHHS